MAEKRTKFGKNIPEWAKYVTFISKHDVYKNMPDCYSNDGSIQWEAPSNRKSGIFKDTHIKRLKWWEQKAKKIGISIKENQWISKTAKTIHPTKIKVCKNCGKNMFIGYNYPTSNLMKRLQKLELLNGDITPLTDILTIIKILFNDYGNKIFQYLPKLLSTKKIVFPNFTNLHNVLKYIELEYIPSEPSMLSPGAMSNAPDRFDGFHSFNLCCRKKVDKGRFDENLKSYVTDRRVFECWADGDWIAADRLMGKVRSQYQLSGCLNGHDGISTADHIGPISIGFSHRPEFQLLCGPCNSTKNNRMSLKDVKHLLIKDSKDVNIISWHSKKLWTLLKNKIHNDETAKRLSKILRDNRHPGFKS